MSTLTSNIWQKNPALHYTEFRWYMLTRFFTIFALNMQSTTIYYWIYHLTGDKLKLGFVGLAEVIPAVLCSLFSGHFIDRNEKRKNLLLCISSYVFLAFGLFYLTTEKGMHHLGRERILMGIYALIFLGGVIRAFVGPSSFALMGFLVPKSIYPNATSWSSMSWQTGAVLGPLTAGIFIARWGVESSMSMVMFLLLIPLFALVRISPKPIVRKSGKEPILESLSEGLRFVFRTPVLLGALALDLFSVLFGGAVALLPVFQRDILKVGETGFGLLRSAPGIGAIITLIILTFLPLKKYPGYKLFGCVAGFGISIIIFGLSKNFYLSFSMLVFSGIFDAVSVVVRGTILQLVTPEDMRGRVAAVNTMFISSSNELGDFESGLMAHWLGPVKAVVVGGMLTLSVVAITYWRAPRLRTFKF